FLRTTAFLPLNHVSLFMLFMLCTVLYPFTERHAQPYFFSCFDTAGRFKMLFISGSFMVSKNDGQRNKTGRLSLPLSGPDGRVLGGNMAGILAVASLIQEIFGSFVPKNQYQSTARCSNETKVVNAPEGERHELPPCLQADTLQADDSKITTSSSDHVDEVDKEEPYPQEELWPRHLGLACNTVGCVDREAWTLASPGAGDLRRDPPTWCRAPFEPEGLLSYSIWCHWHSLWACLDPFQGHVEMLKQWVTMALGLLVRAIVLYFSDAILINKQLYSFSHVCFTARVAGIVFLAFYILEVVKPDQFKAINDEGMTMYQRPFMRDMELNECEETTLHDVNIKEEMRRKQQRAQQEAYDKYDDMHGGDAQRKDCFEVYALVPGLLREELTMEVEARRVLPPEIFRHMAWLPYFTQKQGHVKNE
nr:heparan-alpha-glucosaminide N-acetyltransferase-like [Tanacetum cinerariifolium]